MMLLSGIQGAVLNLNPLIKADGYYALSQFLDIDNLREDSFAFLRVWAEKYLLRRDIDLAAFQPSPAPYLLYLWSRRDHLQRRLLSPSCFCSRKMCSSTKFGDWGYFLFAGVIYFFARKGIKSSLPIVRGWIRKQRESYMTWKLTRAQRSALSESLSSYSCLRFLRASPPISCSSPAATPMFGPRSPGTVARVFVRQGEEVKAGQLIAVLQNPEIEADAQVASAELTLASSNLRLNQDDPASGKSAQAAANAFVFRKQLAVATSKRRRAANSRAF